MNRIIAAVYHNYIFTVHELLQGGDATGWGFRKGYGVTSPVRAFLFDVRGRRAAARVPEETRRELLRLSQFDRCAPGAQEDQRPPSAARKPPSPRGRSRSPRTVSFQTGEAELEGSRGFSPSLCGGTNPVLSG